MSDSIIWTNRFATASWLLPVGIMILSTGWTDESSEIDDSTRPVTAAHRREAKGYFEQGTALFSSNEFEGAIEKFRAAYEIVRSPEILYNIGRCHEKLGQTEKAIYHYEMYLRFYPTTEDSEEVRERIAVQRELLKKEAPPAEEPLDPEPEPEETESPRWFHGMGFGATVGFSYGPVGPANEWSFPFGIFGQFPMGDTWSIFATVFGGRYAGGSRASGATYTAKTQIGVEAGMKANFPVADRFDVYLGAGIGIRRLTFTGNTKWRYLTGTVVGGGAYKLGDSNWSIVTELFATSGPAFGHVVLGSPLDPSPRLQMEIGAKMGLTYVF